MEKEEFDKHIDNLNLQYPKGLEWAKNITELKPYKPHGKSRDYPYMPVFKTPIELCCLEDKEVYRVIPRYPDIMVSESSKIRSVSTCRLIQTSLNGLYTSINVCPLKDGSLSSKSVHVLVAMAWCDNDDYVIKNVVDHKDENKLNNVASNLQWVSQSHNIGLTFNSRIEYRWIMKNLRTGLVTRFMTLTEVGDYLKMNKNNFSAERCPTIIKRNTGGYLLEDRSNFKGWRLEDKYDTYGEKYRYEIDGKKYTYMRDIVKEYGLPAYDALQSEKTVKKLLDMGVNIKMLDKQCNTVHMKHLESGEVKRFKNRKEVREFLGVGKGVVATRFDYRIGLPLKGWLIKNCYEPWPTVKDAPKNTNNKVLLKKDDKTYTFSSIREASRFLNISRKILTSRLNTNETTNGFMAILSSDT
jgi:hypothetical protein